MSFLTVAIIDVKNNNEIVNIEDLTQTGIEMLCHDCRRLLDRLENAEERDEDED